jgi:uncharacterized protein YjdB
VLFNKYITTLLQYPAGKVGAYIIPTSVTAIGGYAFSGTAGLTSVSIGNAVTTIGDYAFSGCTGLTSVYNYRTTPQEIVANVFNGVTLSNDSLYVPAGAVSAYQWADVWKDFGQILVAPELPATGVSLNKSSTTLPLAGTEILAAWVLPVGANPSVRWTSSNTSVATVSDAGVVTAIAVGTATITAASDADYTKTATCTVTVDLSTNNICGSSAADCSWSYNSVTKTLTIAGTGAMRDYSTRDYTCGSSTCSRTTAPWGYYNEAMTSVNISGITSIGAYAFYGTDITSVDVPYSVAYIGGMAFESTPFYRDLYDGVIYLGRTLYAYKGTMPANTSITVWEGTLGICPNVFTNRAGLTSITIPNSVTTIGFNAFYGCTGLTRISIPNSVTEIGTYAFYNCTGLTNLSIGNSVISIGSSAFCNTSITSVSIPNSVTSIGSGAFSGCRWLTSATIGNAVTEIGSSAFYDCPALTSISIPNSVTTIGYSAFEGCTGLTSVYNYRTTPQTIGSSSVFGNVMLGNVSLYVPANAVSAYQAASVWKNFGQILAIPGLPATGVSLNKTSTTLAIGGTETLTATVLPASANQSVTWSSSSTSVARVSDAGVVTAVSAGTATITATTEDGGFRATCAVTVAPADIAVTGVSLSHTTLSLKPNATQQLTATIAPTTATNKNVTWSSSNTSVATVSATGLVTAKTAGTATITVTTQDGNKTATCVVTVSTAGGSDDGGKDPATAVETQAIAALQIYPNPVVNGQLTIDNAQLFVWGKVEIYNVNGGLAGVYNVSDGTSTTINIANLPAGIYIVKVGNKAAKIVKAP